MGKQAFSRIKKVLPILLAFFFLATSTIVSASETPKDPKWDGQYWSEDGHHMMYDGHYWWDYGHHWRWDGYHWCYYWWDNHNYWWDDHYCR
jgi:hypothetical protein